MDSGSGGNDLFMECPCGTYLFVLSTITGNWDELYFPPPGGCPSAIS